MNKHTESGTDIFVCFSRENRILPVPCETFIGKTSATDTLLDRDSTVMRVIRCIYVFLHNFLPAGWKQNQIMNSKMVFMLG